VLRSRAGFTLIELIIVITVIGLISTVVVSSYNRISRGFKSTLAVDNLVSELRSLQSLSLNRQESCYGLAVRDGQSIEFVEVPLVNEFVGCDKQDQLIYRGNFTLNEGVILAGVKQGSSTLPLANLSLLFTPPLGEVALSAASNSTEVIELEIKHPQAEDSSYVTITPSGIISKVEPNA
jgi:prepilin-type N-terminal cleavage/methylation domain-containing protein